MIALELASDHREAPVVWAVFGPAVIWSFVGTGLYAWRARPESRTGRLMILLGFCWFLFTLDAANAPWLYTVGLVTGGLWGGVFLHLGMSFPSGWLDTRSDRALVIAGYLIFPLAFVPALLFAGPEELNCADCPENVLLIRPDADLAAILTGLGALVYAGLFVLVLRRALERWRESDAFLRMQRTPVYVCSLGTFLLVTAARAGAGDVAWWAAYIATGLMPFAFLGGLLRSHVSHLDHELAARMEELRASRARLVEAGDAARRRLERDLHDGAQSRLVALALLLRTARRRAGDDEELATLLDRAGEELRTSLAELRELARGIHPAVLTERGLEPAIQSLAARAPVPVSVEAPAQDAPARPGRERRLLRRLRGARQRGQVLAGHARLGDRRARQRPPHRRGRRRRRRRRRPRWRLRSARPRGPAGGARRHARAREPGRARHPPARPDPRRP